MSEPHLEHYYNKLCEIQPEEIIGYPSNLFILAKFLRKHGLGGIRPRAIFTTAETLLQHQRAIIEEAFERNIVDQYGCTEMALFISQCEKGTYHIHPEYGIVEVIGKDGNPVAPGEEGEAVCTSFINYAMPMIRYRLGDRIVLGMEKCLCGRNFPVAKRILGRVDDTLTTPDGRPLGGLDAVFKGMSDIYETQIIQTNPDKLVFKMVLGDAFTDKSRTELLREIRKRTGSGMIVEIQTVNEIEKDSNGKFRAVKSELKTGGDRTGHSGQYL
jgi:phenylacetate-CoA ligase